MTEAMEAGARLALAAHLIRCGLRSSASPRNDDRYRLAIALWEASAEFRGEAEAIAAGFGLGIAGVNDRGIALSAPAGSLFAPAPSTIHTIYANGQSGKDRAQTAAEARAVLCAVLTVTASMAYPDEHALDGASVPGPVFAREVREKLTTLAEREGGGPPLEDSPAAVPDDDPMPRVWEAVLRCAPIVTTQTGRHREGSLGWHVLKGFELLDANGHADLRKPNGDEGEGDTGLHILPRDRFRKLVRHSSALAHAAVRGALARLDAAPGTAA